MQRENTILINLTGRRKGKKHHHEVAREWVEHLRIAIARSWIIYAPQKGANASGN